MRREFRGSRACKECKVKKEKRAIKEFRARRAIKEFRVFEEFRAKRAKARRHLVIHQLRKPFYILETQVFLSQLFSASSS